MSMKIESAPPVPVLPLAGDRKRTDTAQGDDRKVVRARHSAETGNAADRALERIIEQNQPRQAPQSGRLSIERDETTGEFVYRIINRDTGELIRQWPREDALRMRDALDAALGAVLDRRV